MNSTRPFPKVPAACLLFGLLLGIPLTAGLAETHNQLTADEKKSGWMLLFDGKSTKGWRSFKKDSFPEQGWVIEEGTLKKVGGVRGGDIISTKTFLDFELQWEWKISPKGNNGLKYFITEERSQAIGHEYQMIDDEVVKSGESSTASFYDVLPPAEKKTLKPAGEWNHSRIVAHGRRVEHWLNGEKVLEYELESKELKAAIAQSKFKSVEGFGTRLRGHILLTDHNDEAWYRNVKIRELSPPQ